MLAYADTRGLASGHCCLTDVILAGMAEGGGLYVPGEPLPILPQGWAADWATKSYQERVLGTLILFEPDMQDDALAAAAAQAYGPRFDDPAIAPVREVGGRYVLELFHGPTCAFKDMALQLMPLLFDEAAQIKRGQGEVEGDFLILVATSGDTGKAALEGFKDRESVRIAVLYPKGGVSELQELQMVTQDGANVAVFGIKGDFDAGQAAAKSTFTDAGFAERLAEHGLALSSANSINWGRVLPQIAYYASAYADMVRDGHVEDGEPLDVAVPTGNFGNILAAYYAKRLGVPLRRLVCASNENDVLAGFLESGRYDLTERSLVATPSPSMDILVSSNLERLLYHEALAEADWDIKKASKSVREWMRQLAEEGRFELDPGVHERIRETFVGGSVTNDETLATVREVYESHGRLLDPHTAVAWRLADRLADEAPMLVVATAHWAKFPADVYRALKGIAYGEPIPGSPEGDPSALVQEVSELAGGAPVPAALAGLSSRPVRFTEVIEPDAGSVQQALLDAVSRWGA